ncbi:MAG: alpha-hydroxy acid oxidase [Gammaproteobacteria bacterium]
MKYNPRLPSVADMEARARQRIPRFAWEYLSSGIGHEHGLRRNRSDLDDVLLWPRYLADVGKVDPGCKLFGQQYDLGIGIAPVGLANMMWPGAETHLARAAQQANIPYILSTMGTTPLEEIASHAPDVGWFQLYVPRDRDVMQDLVQRVQRSGFKVLVVTVDIPVGAKRDKELKNGLILPFRFSPSIVSQVMLKPTWLLNTLQQGVPRFINLAPYGDLHDVKHLGEFLTRFFMPGVTMERIREIRQLWSGPLVIKGLLRSEDIEECRAAGVDGVVVSNHGGRQLDAAPSSVAALAKLHVSTTDQFPVLLDSGVRSGLDIVRARALGASFTLSGRSFLYAVAAAGKEGAGQVIEIFRDEITRSLQQLGYTRFEAMNGDWLN